MWWAAAFERSLQAIQDRWRTARCLIGEPHGSSQRRWRSRCRWMKSKNSWSLQVAVLQGFGPTTLLKGVDLES
jgi:hypothetical protein